MEKRDDIGFRIRHINNMMRQQANANLKSYDLTLSQMRVLFYLDHTADHTARLKELEKFFQVSQPTMAGIVVRLEEKKFIQSKSDPNDKRVKLVQITPAGQAMIRVSAKQSEEMEKRILDGMGYENAEQLKKLLDLLYETLKKEGKEQ